MSRVAVVTVACCIELTATRLKTGLNAPERFRESDLLIVTSVSLGPLTEEKSAKGQSEALGAMRA